MSNQLSLRPLIVGEVLFDCFSDHRVLGGAPFNVAWNLKGLGLDPLVITAVGQDDYGREVLADMQAWKMDVSGVQVHSSVPTGRVDISVSAGQPSYVFWHDVAFDRIQFNDGICSQHSFGLLYHGSLALRGSTSLTTIGKWRQHANCPIFIDVNIRQPHFNWITFEPFLYDADHVKMNDEELNYLNQLVGTGMIPIPDSWESRRETANELMAGFKIKNLWLTAGNQGAAWLGPDGQYAQVDAPHVPNLVDTVGAGDALAAVIIRSILTGRPAAEALLQAVEFAARICTLRGAITRKAEFYRLSNEV